MKLDHKDLSFLIEAVEFRLGWYSEQLKRTDLDDDEFSDLSNDEVFLRALLTSLNRARAGD